MDHFICAEALSGIHIVNTTTCLNVRFVVEYGVEILVLSLDLTQNNEKGKLDFLIVTTFALRLIFFDFN